MAQVLAKGTGAASSTTQTVSPPMRASLFTGTDNFMPHGVKVYVKMVGSDGKVYPIGILDAETPALTISAPGGYVFSRTADSLEVGVDLS